MTAKKKTKAPKKTGGSAKPTSKGRVTKTGRKPDPKAAKKKSAPQRRKKSPNIKAETYNALQTAYFERQSIEGAAKTVGVTKNTARYYIDGPGKPEVGMVPIKQLWLDVQMEAQEKRQMTLLRFHEEQTKELEEVLNTVSAELKLIRASVLRRVKRFKDSGGVDIETGASLGQALKSYERVSRLMERFLGAPDATLEHRGEDRYRHWTDEEIVEFAETGKLPDHAR